MRVEERFLKYVSVWTTSNENSNTVPSTQRQYDLANILVEEMKEIGIADAKVDEKGYVYGTVPATKGLEDKKALGLIAHMDTAPEYSGNEIKPQIIRNYDGQDIRLGESNQFIKVQDFPHLTGLKGRTIITTDGTTLLGADDKAGIAEILTVVAEIIKEDMPHGKLCVGFTPDEEIGRGANHFDVEGFGADYAYTLDGSEEGEIQFENFHASTAIIKVQGVSVHTGTAKDVLVNALTIATELHQMLPVEERPETTEGYEGFYHLMHMDGGVSLTTMKYLIRDFDRELFEKKEAFLQQVVDNLNEKYGENVVELEVIQSYRNMREQIEPCYFLIEYAKRQRKMQALYLI